MTKTNKAIESAVRNFVAELQGLLRQAAIEEAHEALGAALQGDEPAAAAPAPKARRGRRVAKATTKSAVKRVAKRAKATKAAKPKTTKTRRGPGSKRTPEQLEATKMVLVDYLRKNPGVGIEQMGKDVGMSTAEMRLPMKQLVATKKVKMKGEKRAAKYSAR